MFKVQQFTGPSSLTLHYHVGTGAPEKEMLASERSLQRERSLSPDSLEQRLLKQHLMGDDADDDESPLTSSSSFIDSISVEPPQTHHSATRSSNSTKTILKTLTSHGFLSFANDHDDDLDDDLDEIHFDQDDVNLLFSDPEDGGPFRFANESIDIDDDYDDEPDRFYTHIRPLSVGNLPDSSVPSSSSVVFADSQAQYSSYHLLDPISEAASEEERCAAISIIRQQQQKHKRSTSSSLSTSANDHCDGDTTINDDLSTLSDIDEQNTSMDDNSISQNSSSVQHDQHIHKKRRLRQNRPIQWITKIGRKWTKYRSKRLTRSRHK